MSPEKFEEFMAKLEKLPPMGNVAVPSDVDFWKEMDARQNACVVTIPKSMLSPPTVQLDLFDEA